METENKLQVGDVLIAKTNFFDLRTKGKEYPITHIVDDEAHYINDLGKDDFGGLNCWHNGFNLKPKGKPLEKYYGPVKVEYKPEYVPYQTCPLCGGVGSIPCGMVSTSITQTCDVCKGAKVIPMHKIN